MSGAELVLLGAACGVACRELVALMRKALEVRSERLQAAERTAVQARDSAREAMAVATGMAEQVKRIDDLERQLEPMLIQAGLVQEVGRR